MSGGSHHCMAIRLGVRDQGFDFSWAQSEFVPYLVYFCYISGLYFKARFYKIQLI